MLRDSIFVSYSRHDTEARDAIVANLQVILGDPPDVRLFADTSIETGEEWRQRLREELDRAVVVVFLVSTDFLTSEFVRTMEIPRAAQAARRDELSIACLYVRPSAVQHFRLRVKDHDGDYFEVRLVDYQGINDPKTPVMSKEGVQREELVLQAAEEIVRLARKALGKRSHQPAREFDADQYERRADHHYFISGVRNHFLPFVLSLAALTSLVHFVVFPLDPDRILLSARNPLGPVTGEGLGYLTGVLGAWWDERMLGPMREVFAVSWGSPDVPCLIAAVLFGMAWWGFFFYYAYRLSARFDPQEKSPSPDTRAGSNAQDDMEWRFGRRLIVASVLVVFAITWGFAFNTEGPVHYAFFVPLAFAVGGIIVAVCLIHSVERLWPSNLARRSLFLTIEGAAAYGAFLAALTPFAIVFLLSLSGMAWTKLGFAAVSLVAVRRMLLPVEKEREPSRMERSLKRPALAVGVVLAFLFGFSAISDLLLMHYPEWASTGKFWFAPLVTFLLSFGLFSALWSMEKSRQTAHAICTPLLRTWQLAALAGYFVRLPGGPRRPASDPGSPRG